MFISSLMWTTWIGIGSWSHDRTVNWNFTGILDPRMVLLIRLIALLTPLILITYHIITKKSINNVSLIAITLIYMLCLVFSNVT